MIVIYMDIQMNSVKDSADRSLVFFSNFRGSLIDQLVHLFYLIVLCLTASTKFIFDLKGHTWMLLAHMP